MSERAARRVLVAGVLLIAGSAWAVGQAVGSFTSSPANPSPNQLVQFTDTTSPTPTSWSWTFGDPGLRRREHLDAPESDAHLTAAPGVYPVTLTRTGLRRPVTNPVSVAARRRSVRRVEPDRRCA